MRKALVIALTLGATFGVALGDWQPNYKMHWPQLPDLSPTGIDVKMSGVVLGDDFTCIETGPIEDVHFWASFREDRLPADGPESVTLQLEFWTNNPGDDQTPSRPEQLIQSYTITPADYTVKKLGPIDEDWLDPVQGEWINDDHQLAFQYNILIDEPIRQEFGQTYWLVLTELTPAAAEYEMGWKTTTVKPVDLRYMDDAVYRNAAGGWAPMVYPLGHEFAAAGTADEETLDLAFVITPEPTTIAVLLLGGMALAFRRRRRLAR